MRQQVSINSVVDYIGVEGEDRQIEKDQSRTGVRALIGWEDSAKAQSSMWKSMIQYAEKHNLVRRKSQAIGMQEMHKLKAQIGRKCTVKSKAVGLSRNYLWS